MSDLSKFIQLLDELDELDELKEQIKKQTNENLIRIVEGLGADAADLVEKGLPKIIYVPQHWSEENFQRFKDLLEPAGCMVARQSFTKDLLASWADPWFARSALQHLPRQQPSVRNQLYMSMFLDHPPS